METFNNIIEINEMIDLLDDYFGNSLTTKPLIVGGMVGTELSEYVLSAAVNRYDISQVLFIQGCQDFIDLLNEKNAMYNQYTFYADLFNEVPVDGIEPYDAFKPKSMQPQTQYITILNRELLKDYEVIIINDAHLIPQQYLNSILQYCSCSVVLCVDPFDIHGDRFSNVPTVVDTFVKLSPIKVYARQVFNIESRSMNKRSNNIVREGKINLRSVGKIDDKQYIAVDDGLIDMVRMKQLKNNFHKNNKVIVTGDRLNQTIDTFNLHTRRPTIVRNSLVVVSSTQTQHLLKLRVYGSKNTFYGDLTYFDTENNTGKILCKPANILSLEESAHHKYQYSVLVLHDEILTCRQRYTILKNTNNLTVARL